MSMCFPFQLQVVAIKLKESRLLDEISDKRCLVRVTSSPSLASQAEDHVNTYSDGPKEATSGDLQAGQKVTT